jgi:hypothetical protein
VTRRRRNGEGIGIRGDLLGTAVGNGDSDEQLWRLKRHCELRYNASFDQNLVQLLYRGAPAGATSSLSAAASFVQPALLGYRLLSCLAQAS